MSKQRVTIVGSADAVRAAAQNALHKGYEPFTYIDEETSLPKHNEWPSYNVNPVKPFKPKR